MVAFWEGIEVNRTVRLRLSCSEAVGMGLILLQV